VPRQGAWSLQSHCHLIEGKDTAARPRTDTYVVEPDRAADEVKGKQANGRGFQSGEVSIGRATCTQAIFFPLSKPEW